MYTKAIRTTILDSYSCAKKLTSPFLRFWAYPHEFSGPRLAKKFPGPAHQEAINKVQATQLIDGQAHVSVTYWLMFIVAKVYQF